MVDVKELISKLNDEQIKPVKDTEGAVLVIAGAGSGKTRVLTSRIAYLVAEKGVNPKNIVAITFTNKAAKEMKDRLTKILGQTEEMWVSTIHSMCVKILRRDAEKLGYDKNFTIYDEIDKDKVLKRVCESLSLDIDKYLKGAKNFISSAKNDCLTPEEARNYHAQLFFIDEYVKIYKEYENQLNRSNALDFDDLLFVTYKLFSKFPEVAEYYSNKFHYVHIDEFQDTNKVQYLIAKRLSLTHGNLFVVGDDDQSIYGWRGAIVENILEFDTEFPNAKVYKLERNYRSTKKILDLANCIIANNTGRRDKKLWTDNSEGARIETFVGGDENNEASYVALQIKNLLDRGYKYSDFGVFMRINAISRAFEQEFTKYGIPYKVYGGFRFFERKEIKDLLAYLRIIANPSDDESFLRAVSTPKRGIGEKTLVDLKEYSQSLGLSLIDAIDFLGGSTLSASAIKKLVIFKNLIVSFGEFAKQNDAPNLLKHVIKTTSFLEIFEEDTEENESRKYNVNELINVAELFVKENPGSDLYDFLNSVTLSTDTDDIKEDDAVSIATIHAVKGLEFKCVFVAGLDEKILPSARSYDSEEDLEEERRLMYVAITRAKERLYLTRANSRYMYGRREYMIPSRYIKEGEPILKPEIKIERPTENYSYSSFNKGYINDGFPESTSSSGYNSSYAKSLLNSSKPKENSSNLSGYKSGTKVRHQKFGDGIVIKMDGEIAEVAFKGVGIKKLAVKYAPMEII